MLQKVRIKQIQDLLSILDSKLTTTDLMNTFVSNSNINWIYYPGTKKLEARLTDVFKRKVYVENLYTNITDFVTARYRNGNEFSEGDVISLKRSSRKEVWIHNGKHTHTIQDFTRIEYETSDSYIKNLFQATSPIVYDKNLGKFKINKATKTANGYLTSTDWNTFNNKSDINYQQAKNMILSMFFGDESGIDTNYNTLTDKIDLINIDGGDDQPNFFSVYGDQGYNRANNHSDKIDFFGRDNIKTQVLPNNTIRINGLDSNMYSDKLGTSFILSGPNFKVDYSTQTKKYTVRTYYPIIDDFKTFQTIYSDNGIYQTDTLLENLNILGGTNIKTKVVSDRLFVTGLSDKEIPEHISHYLTSQNIIIEYLPVDGKIRLSLPANFYTRLYNFKTIKANTGQTIANSTSGTLNILGIDNVFTSIVNDTVTISGLTNLDIQSIIREFLISGNNININQTSQFLYINAVDIVTTGENIFKTIVANTSSTTANTNNDKLYIKGGTNSKVRIINDNVYIDGKSDQELATLTINYFNSYTNFNDTNLANTNLIATSERSFTIFPTNASSFIIQTPTFGSMITFDSLNNRSVINSRAVFNGNLTVIGNPVNFSEDSKIADNYILLNSNITGLPTQDAGLEINRGTSGNVQVLWNENMDRWELSYPGNNYYQIWTIGNDGAGSGLDSDLLDGQSSNYYQNASNFTSGVLTASRLSGNYIINITGNSNRTNNFNIPRKIELTGDVTGFAYFDGTSDIQIVSTINPSILGSDGTDHNHDSRYIRTSSFVKGTNTFNLNAGINNNIKLKSTNINFNLTQGAGTFLGTNIINLQPTDAGSQQKMFKTIQTSGIDQFSASNNNDILNFVGDYTRIRLNAQILNQDKFIYHRLNQTVENLNPGDYIGEAIRVTGATFTIGSIYYKENNVWSLSNINLKASNKNILGIAVESDVILTSGFYRGLIGSWVETNFTGTGNPAYLSSISGTGTTNNLYLTQDPVIVRRIIGYDYLFKTIYFKPDTIDEFDYPDTDTCFISDSFETREGLNGTVTVRNIFGRSVYKFKLDVLGGTAINGVDYLLDENVEYYVNPSTQTDIVFPTYFDLNSEDDKTIILAITDLESSPNTVPICCDCDTNITIINTTQPNSISFQSSTYSVTEGTSSVNLVVVSSDNSNISSTFQVQISGGTAQLNTDFTFNSSQIYSIGRNSSVNIPVGIINETETDGNETVTFIITNISNGNVGSQFTTTLTIIDNDVPNTVYLSNNSINALEGSIVTFSVCNTNLSNSSSTYHLEIDGLSTANNSDYTGFDNATYTLSPGQCHQYSINLTEDNTSDNLETLVINLIGQTSNSNNNQLTITINDVPKVNFASSSSTFAEGTSSNNLPIVFTNHYNTMSIDVVITGGTASFGNDYTSSDFALVTSIKTITISPSDPLTYNVLLNVLSDVIVESTETITFSLQNPINCALGTITTHTINITNVVPPLTVGFNSSSASVTEGNSNNVGVVYSYIPPSVTASVDLVIDQINSTSSFASDYTVAGFSSVSTIKTISITSSSTNTLFNTLVSILKDSVSDGGETVIFKLQNPVNCTLTSNTIYTITITNLLAGNPSIATFGNFGSATSKWFGGALADTGIIYAAPYNSTTILRLDPSNNTSSLIGSLGSTTGKWIGLVKGVNGKLYGIPYNSTSILEINPTTDAITNIGSFSGNEKWGGGVLAPNGKIYCIPQDASSILVIDTNNSTATTNLLAFTNSFGNAFMGGVLGKNGKIYGFAYNNGSILEIDPSNDTTNIYSLSMGGNHFYTGGSLGFDNIAYAAPDGFNQITTVNTNNTIPTFTTTGNGNFFNAGANGASRFRGSVTTFDGKIYGVPYDNTNIYTIDSANGGTISSISASFPSTLSGWCGGVLAPNGNVYYIPFNASIIMTLVISTGQQLASDNLIPSPVSTLANSNYNRYHNKL